MLPVYHVGQPQINKIGKGNRLNKIIKNEQRNFDHTLKEMQQEAVQNEMKNGAASSKPPGIKCDSDGSDEYNLLKLKQMNLDLQKSSNLAQKIREYHSNSPSRHSEGKSDSAAKASVEESSKVGPARHPSDSCKFPSLSGLQTQRVTSSLAS